jgi:8-oxo-dGTP pyrophosphatase MutT (NUDIX family)
MKILAEIHRAEGINTNGRTIHRTAVRAVILRGRDLLMVYSSSVGDYKFPGGGVDADETHEHALARELLEECGATLFRVDGQIGAVIEYNFPVEKDLDVFKMTSHYYWCKIIDGVFSEQKLDGYEKDLGFTPAWVDIDEAIRKNKSLQNVPDPPEWLNRENFVLEYINATVLRR